MTNSFASMVKPRASTNAEPKSWTLSTPGLKSESGRRSPGWRATRSRTSRRRHRPQVSTDFLAIEVAEEKQAAATLILSAPLPPTGCSTGAASRCRAVAAVERQAGERGRNGYVQRRRRCRRRDRGCLRGRLKPLILKAVASPLIFRVLPLADAMSSSPWCRSPERIALRRSSPVLMSDRLTRTP